MAVDHSALNRLMTKYAPEFEKVSRHRQQPVGSSWWLDETDVNMKGEGAYLYRVMDKEYHTIDFLLTPTRDWDTAEAFLRKAIRCHSLPQKITVDKSGSNIATITHYPKTHKTTSVIRHSKDLHTVGEQAHRAVKRIVRPLLGYKSFGRPGVRSPAEKSCV